MNKYTAFTLLIFLNGLSTIAANASDDTSSAISAVAARGPGPVINPENSQYMEDKNAAEKKRIESKAHNKKQHAKKTTVTRRKTDLKGRKAGYVIVTLRPFFSVCT
ncbi:hypothetical protein F6T93_001527 [Enterobacter hormaechei]|nr:hypothetical protein [Enterobacter hormaechei]